MTGKAPVAAPRTAPRGTTSKMQHKTKSAFRPDVQGLRMVAVVAVILDHLFGWPAGGFVGVDVFFVISGFLITSLLLREYEKSGTISFVGFYRRRLKRIAPAATLVLVVVIVAAYFLLIRSRAVATFWDGVWAFLFVANWNFAAQGTDYFQADAPPSPLRHFWSLSVEEQFYFVWPWVMLMILLLVIDRLRMTSRAALVTVGGLMVAITVASFAFSTFETQTSPTWSYFSTLSRAWELGAGAIVAIFAARLSKLPTWLRAPFSWLGLAGIVVSLFVVSADKAFPAPWALLPVAATALVIIAGIGTQPRFIWPLSNPVSQWLGDLSYSLYLWHWPIIVLLPALLPSQSFIFYISALSLMIGLSAFSYYAVEDPIRKSRWLEPKSANDFRRRKRRKLGAHRSIPMRVQVLAVSSIAAVSLILVVVALAPPTPPSTAERPPGVALESTGNRAEPETMDPLVALIRDATAATSWPALTPDIGLAADIRPVEDSSGCGDVSHTKSETCTFGEGDRLAVVVGDSVSNTWIATVRAALEADGWKIRGLSKAGCPMVDADTLRDGRINAECAEHRAWVHSRIAELRPQVVVMSGTEGKANGLASGAEGTAAVAEWGEAAHRAYKMLAASGARVVAISPMPLGPDPSDCYRPLGGAPVDCLGTIKPLWRTISSAEKTAAELAGAVYVDTHEWFCYEEKCPAFAGTTLMRADNVHMTPEYSRMLGPRLKPYLLNE